MKNNNNDDNVLLIARLLHKEFRGVIQRTKSKIATYTLASYDLVNEYTLFETEDTIEFKKLNPEEDFDYLLDDVWRDYVKLTDYLFELDNYDKEFNVLSNEVREKFIDLSKKIIQEIK